MTCVRIPLTVLLAAGLLALGGCEDDDHDHDHDHEADHGAEADPPDEPEFDPLAAHVVSPRHGGLVTPIGDRIFETVYRDDSVEVHVTDPSGSPVSVEGARGTAILENRDPSRMPVIAPLAPAGDRLVARLDLTGVTDGAARVAIRIEGLGPEPIVYRRIVRR